MKNYLLTVLENCSEHKFGQDAVEWAIVSGHIVLTYDLQTDLCAIMGEPGKSQTGQYDNIIEAYQRHCSAQRDQLMQSYITPDTSGLEEILRPVPLASAPVRGTAVSDEEMAEENESLALQKN